MSDFLDWLSGHYWLWHLVWFVLITCPLTFLLVVLPVWLFGE